MRPAPCHVGVLSVTVTPPGTTARLGWGLSSLPPGPPRWLVRADEVLFSFGLIGVFAELGVDAKGAGRWHRGGPQGCVGQQGGG